MKGPSPALRAPSPMPRGTGEGDNLRKSRLLPFEEWEKVATIASLRCKRASMAG
jgi:hypothetical protein